MTTVRGKNGGSVDQTLVSIVRFFSQLDEGIMVIDPKGCIQWLNNAMKGMCAIKGEISGLELRQFITIHIAPYLKGPIDTDVLISGKLENGADPLSQFSLAIPGNRTRIIEFSSYAFSAGGEGQTRIDLYRCVTDGGGVASNREPVAASEHDRELFRSIFEHARLGVLIAQDGQAKYINPWTSSYLGRSAEYICSVPFTDFIHPEDRQRVMEYHRRRIAGETLPDMYTFRILDDQGKEKWVKLNVFLFRWNEKPATLNFLIDVSDQIETENALRESEEKYRRITERNYDAIVMNDREGVITYASPSIERISGFSSEFVKGKHFTSILPESEHIRNTECFDQILNGENIEGFTTYLQKRDGKLVLVEMNAIPLTRDGNVIGSQGIIRDISDRERAEEAERERDFIDYLLSASLWNTPLGMVMIHIQDMDAKIIDWNLAAESIFGWRKSEALGNNFIELLPVEEVVPKIQNLLTQMEKDQFPFNLQHECNTKSGDRVLVNWFNTPISDPKGQGIYLVSLAEDVTESKRAEEALRESEVRYRTTIDSIGDPVHVIDRKFRIILVNRAFTHWFESLGFPTDVIGKHLHMVIPVFSPNIHERYKWVFNTGEMVVVEETSRFGDTEMITETRVIPVFEGGEVVRVVTVIRDITGNRKLEKLKREAFHQIERNMEQFAILNDHIRNPLQAIIGIAELEGGGIAEKMYTHTKEIDTIINKLDVGYMESQKIRDFLNKHYGLKKGK
jgi:PAS domain S-box-containing protein